MPLVGKISRVAGPVVVAKHVLGAQMYELVRVGEMGLIGEIIKLEGENATIQVYEETTGLKPGEKVECTGGPLSAELGPGLLGQIFDGVQRPLTTIEATAGPFVRRGVSAPALNREKKWPFTPSLRSGEKVEGGDILGTVQETSLLTHKPLVPPGASGRVKEASPEGAYTVKDTIAVVETEKGEEKLSLMQVWPVRNPRPYVRKVLSDVPLLTGQRVIDAFFPIAKGGTAAIPGGFGTGKTILQHQLAQWADADIIIYVGCGERGNEMSEVLERFPELKDPQTGHPLMDRTILVANVSNMPIAAREASIYTGITMGEYFRDMGYDVALMADSTSRWAEALREISGRLEEMPGEEGYTAYLAGRLSEFYERGGRVESTGTERRVGSISIVGAVSPPGGDFSEPVTVNTLRTVKVFWGLDEDLAKRRHFPAINWLRSYSLYSDSLEDWFRKNVDEEWESKRREAMAILQREEELREIVQLVGPDALSESQRVDLEAAKMIREDFLMQHAYHPVDTYCDIAKSKDMLSSILQYYDKTKQAVERGVPLQKALELPVKEEIARLRIQPRETFGEVIKRVDRGLEEQFTNLLTGGR